MQEEKNKHFIRNIEIKNFKCFENFKAEGFGRVNLIGGKNNVGKTAFMEACFLIQNASFWKREKIEENRELFYLEIIKWIILLELNRKRTEFLIEWIKDEFELTNFSKFNISLPQKKFYLEFEENYINPNQGAWNYGGMELSKYRDNKYFYRIYKKNSLPQIENTTFITPYNATHYNLSDMVDTLKIDGKYESINKFMMEIFNIEKIDIIKNKVMVQQDNSFKDLNDLGDGLKHSLHIVLSLLVNKDNVIFLDEIENGIHYTNLDKLWEIILTISKQQNIQVFATTHSKECIESYARVAEKLDEEDITMTTMARNLKDELKALVWDRAQFFSEMEQNHEVRGW